MAQKPLFKAAKKPTKVSKSDIAKKQRASKSTARGRRAIKPKKGLETNARLDKAISAQINNEIESNTASAAYGHGSTLKVVHAVKPVKEAAPKKRKPTSLPAHKTQK